MGLAWRLRDVSMRRRSVAVVMLLAVVGPLAWAIGGVIRLDPASIELPWAPIEPITSNCRPPTEIYFAPDGDVSCRVPVEP